MSVASPPPSGGCDTVFCLCIPGGRRFPLRLQPLKLGG
jgi:hypothetical protein